MGRPPGALPASSRWPFLARSVGDTAKVLSGASASIDRARTAPILHVVVGGSLWSSNSSGSIGSRSTTVEVTSPASPETGAAVDATVTLSAATLDTVYGVLSIASTARDWTPTADSYALDGDSYVI